jgi:hypothetical protein
MEVVMAKRISIIAALAALIIGTSGVALAQGAKSKKRAPLATVEAVQMPAWVERGGASLPLAPGMELRDRDSVRTGGRSRVLLRMADGGAVKLGENGTLAFDGLRLREDDLFEGAMKVAEGAFRYTSEFFSRFRGKRDLRISISTVTAGIRGTDLWGKATANSELVCLLDGKIEVTDPKGATFNMDERFSVYTNENGVPKPVERVPADVLDGLKAETEPQDGKGVSIRGGKWKVTISKGLAANDALDFYEGLRRSGYAAEIVPAKAGNKRIYNVRLSGFETKADAEAVADDLKEQRGEYQYKVSR